MREHTAYRLAKEGKSNQAALSLVYDLISDKAIAHISGCIEGMNLRIVAVHAEESGGRNKIPMAYAEALGGLLGCHTDPGIVQASVANHGGAPSIYHRMVSQPAFSGYVEPEAKYLIVDDTCTAGGTLANLKGFIESNGGIVIAMSVLGKANVSKPYYISLAPETLARLKYRLAGLHEFWVEEFGYGLENLTEGEAGHLLAAPSVDTIRNRLAEARRDLNLDGNEDSDGGAESQAEERHDQADDG